jgi:hypothetical protein
MPVLKRLSALACLAIALLCAPASAQELARPAGDVVLTIDGAIATMNADGAADFDMQMLEAMPKVTIATTTPWIAGKATFEGVLLKDLLARIGADGTTISAVALNDYAVPLPMSDANSGAIIAYKMNGEYMPVRAKGPLWIMFPFDDKPELKTEAAYSRCVWQLRRLTISK